MSCTSAASTYVLVDLGCKQTPSKSEISYLYHRKLCVTCFMVMSPAGSAEQAKMRWLCVSSSTLGWEHQRGDQQLWPSDWGLLPFLKNEYATVDRNQGVKGISGPSNKSIQEGARLIIQHTIIGYVSLHAQPLLGCIWLLPIIDLIYTASLLLADSD